jgi:glycosyltransferase involved in cell wall biosynthesis
MRTLILAAGRFGSSARLAIESGREPRLDVFEIAARIDADILDYLDVERSSSRRVQAVARAAGLSPALAELGFLERKRYDAVLTTGEDIGLPLALLLKVSRSPIAHTMIAHTLLPLKKRVFFKPLGVQSHIDKVLAYSTTEERLMVGELGIPTSKVERIYYHADQRFFAPTDQPVEPDLICAAGQLLRDYDCLVDATRDLPIRVSIAAGSPWITKKLQPTRSLPENVTWGKLGRFELRDLYRRSAIAVVPILQNHYQTGIATILEMMAMGKCVIATRTHGQTDTIVDGENGLYVPPSDPRALRAAIERMLANREEAARLGRAAREFVEKNASLDLFVERLSKTVEQTLVGRESERSSKARVDATP